MSFSSFHFLVFAFTVFGANQLLHGKAGARKNMLLAASYYFYMCWDWRFSVLLALVAAVNYLAGIKIESSKSPAQRRLWLSLALTICLCILGCFKYANFFIEGAAAFLQNIGFVANLPLLNILLPIGISFFTFQGISYTIDVYRGQQVATHDFRDFALFVAFFPTVLSGPITRARQLLTQFESPLPYSTDRSQEGLFLTIRGFIKKIAFADILALHIVNPAFTSPDSFSPLFLVTAVYAYSFQIYMDLSGYTDIARGVAKLLGYDLPENFNRPYQATSVSNFWQRWHISMSGFFRDYLYFGVGGSKHGNTYVNLLITFVAIGMWHGAGLKFVAYGLVHGSCVCIERFLRIKQHDWRLDSIVKHLAFTIASIVLTFHFVAFSRILFRSDNLEHATYFFSSIMSSTSELCPLGLMGLAALGISTILHYTPQRWTNDGFRLFSRLPDFVQGLIIAVVIPVLVALSSRNASFVYFQF